MSEDPACCNSDLTQPNKYFLKIYCNLEKVIMKWENGFDQVSRSNILTFTSRSDRMACYKPVLLVRITGTAELKKKKKNLFKEIRESFKPLELIVQNHAMNKS